MIRPLYIICDKAEKTVGNIFSLLVNGIQVGISKIYLDGVYVGAYLCHILNPLIKEFVEGGKKCLQSFFNPKSSDKCLRILPRHLGTWWVSGYQECGKSVLAAFLLEHIEDLRGSTNVSYFCCNGENCVAQSSNYQGFFFSIPEVIIEGTTSIGLS